ncbi:MAG TPA: DUF5110 domain-containing protein, partial [Terracidiphilus sp.]|nr:DUF5110 domain-containing protein [Terracidiphilus sp.]
AVDLATIPLYVRAGAIVPIGPVKQYTGEPNNEPVTLRVYPGADGHFTWYDDDGASYRYESGEFMRVECVWRDADRTLTLTLDPAGRMQVPNAIRVELADSTQSKLVTLQLKGTTVKL